MATGCSSDEDDPENDVRPVERMEDTISLVTIKQIGINPNHPTVKSLEVGENESVRLPSEISDVDSTVQPTNGGEGTLEPMNLPHKNGCSEEEALVTTSGSVV